MESPRSLTYLTGKREECENAQTNLTSFNTELGSVKSTGNFSIRCYIFVEGNGICYVLTKRPSLN